MEEVAWVANWWAYLAECYVCTTRVTTHEALAFATNKKEGHPPPGMTELASSSSRVPVTRGIRATLDALTRVHDPCLPTAPPHSLSVRPAVMGGVRSVGVSAVPNADRRHELLRGPCRHE